MLVPQYVLRATKILEKTVTSSKLHFDWVSGFTDRFCTFYLVVLMDFGAFLDFNTTNWELIWSTTNCQRYLDPRVGVCPGLLPGLGLRPRVGLAPEDRDVLQGFLDFPAFVFFCVLMSSMPNPTTQILKTRRPILPPRVPPRPETKSE